MTLHIGSKYCGTTGDYVVVSTVKRGHTVRAELSPDSASDRPGFKGFTVTVDNYRA